LQKGGSILQSDPQTRPAQLAELVCPPISLVLAISISLDSLLQHQTKVSFFFSLGGREGGGGSKPLGIGSMVQTID